jgi:hypothetical protein
MNEETSSRRKPDTTATRIMMQYFRGETLVCELRADGASLNLHISRGDGKGGQRDEGWHVEAHVKVATNDIVIGGSAQTREAALLAVGARWAESDPELGLHPFNWVEVAAALKSVSAIE